MKAGENKFDIHTQQLALKTPVIRLDVHCWMQQQLTGKNHRCGMAYHVKIAHVSVWQGGNKVHLIHYKLASMYH